MQLADSRWKYLALAPLAIAAAPIALAEAPPALPPGPETNRVIERCTACHGLDYLTKQPAGRGAQWWSRTIDDMVDTHGADIPDADRKAIADYLTRQFG